MAPHEAFVDEARISAAEAQIRYERDVLEHIIESVHSAFRKLDKKSQLLRNKSNFNYKHVIRWWDEHHGGLPGHLKFLNTALEHGHQPVFCNVSLASWGTRGTVLMPVAGTGDTTPTFNDVLKTMWLYEKGSADPNWEQASSNWSETFRQYFHAVLNIAHGVRLFDAPCMGFVAAAHRLQKGEFLYIPDATKIPKEGSAIKFDDQREARVVSSAAEEEKFLGLSSVLYIPILFDESTGVSMSDGAYAVLMLWSPVPNRWPHLNQNSKEVIVGNDEELYNALHEHTGWLKHYLQKERADRETIEVTFLSVLHSVVEASADATHEKKKRVEGAFHGLDEIITYLSGVPSSKEPWSDVECLEFQMYEPEGLIKELESVGDKRQDNLDVQLVIYREVAINAMEIKRNFKPSEMKDVRSLIPSDLTLAIPKNIARRLIIREVYDHVAHADNLDRISISLSDQYLTLRFHETAKRETADYLTNINGNYWPYFAIRRGIPVARGSNRRTSGGGMGIGLAMFSALMKSARIYRAVYCSPDGKTIWSELAFPHTRKYTG